MSGIVADIKMIITPDDNEMLGEIYSTEFSNGYRYLRIQPAAASGFYSFGYTDSYGVYQAWPDEEVKSYDIIASQGQQKWLPKFGEEAEFSDTKEAWTTERFSHYVPRDAGYDWICISGNGWNYCRPIQNREPVEITGMYNDKLKRFVSDSFSTAPEWRTVKFREVLDDD